MKMDKQKVAKELLKVAKDLLVAEKPIMVASEKKQSTEADFKKLAKLLENMRGKYQSTSDEAVFLSIVRDMAFKINKGNWQAVKRLALSIKEELDVEIE